MIKTIAIIIGLLLLVGVGAKALFYITETESNHFDTYEEVVASELIGKGWIPDFIPKSTKNIREAHRVDVPHISVSFDFDPSDVEAFKRVCTQTSKKSCHCKIMVILS
jgi:hypothetical protein